MRDAPILVLCFVFAASCAARPPAASTWQVRFGPVMDTGIITGHTTTGSIAWLATSSDALIRIDLAAGTHARKRIQPLAPGEHTWGLAATEPFGLFTLIGRNVLGEITADGIVLRRLALDSPHVGVFADGRHLLYQVMNLQPPSQALFAGPPGTERRRPWGAIRTREMPLVRGAVAALNLLSCGGTAGEWTPCWFPDEPLVTMTKRSGESVRVAVPGLPAVARETLLAAENPRRPVRDAFATAAGGLWVLGSGEPPVGAEPRPGGWLLVHMTDPATMARRVRLREPARVILAASRDTCTLLAWDGRVVEVRP